MRKFMYRKYGTDFNISAILIEKGIDAKDIVLGFVKSYEKELVSS